MGAFVLKRLSSLTNMDFLRSHRPNNFVIEGVGGSWRSKVIGAECGRVGSVRSRIGSDGKSSPPTFHKNCTFNTCSSDERTSPNPETYRVMRINVGGSTEISG